MELASDPEFRSGWALADEALALARETGDMRTLAVALRQAFYAYWSPQTLELRSALSTELPSAPIETQDPAFQWSAHVIELHVCVEQGEFDRAQVALERASRSQRNSASRR